jgi:hypothetical protein
VLVELPGYIDTRLAALAELLLSLVAEVPLLLVAVVADSPAQIAGRVLAALRDLQVALLETDTQLAAIRQPAVTTAPVLVLAETLRDADHQTETRALLAL